MRAYERFIKYVKIHTTSDENSGTFPSSARQFDLACLLAEEMKQMGIEDARVDENCYVYGSIPATPGYEDRICLGFLAHLDTSPDASGENVVPMLWKGYDGGDIVLKMGRVISPEMFPHLSDMKGRTLITSDGTTLLGADDKSGIAEIMTMAERLFKEDRPHGRIAIAFTPDEEIGHGADALDLESFGADLAYTVDGGLENEIEYENFNAASADFIIVGKGIHPGESKNRMVNAGLVAAGIISMLPPAETPSHTEQREGFYHLTHIEGNVENARVSFIVRDHSSHIFEARIHTLKMIEKTLNERYGDGTVTLTIKEQYRNMVEKIRPCMHLIDYAKKAMENVGLTPREALIRGGTDGARLSFRGLPCPNLGTGGYGVHGPYEHISVEGMDLVVEVLLGIVGLYADHTSVPTG